MHNLIVGRSGSGKTVLARHMAGLYRQRGGKVLVFDPIGSDIPSDVVTADPEEFYRYYFTLRNHMVIIDEAGDWQKTPDLKQAIEDTARKGRHQGHVNHYVGQRHVVIARTTRDQCSKLFLFRVGKGDAKSFAEDWADDRLLDATTLGVGEFFIVDGLNPAERKKLTFREG